MSENETTKTFGTAELVEFGEYLHSLRGAGRTFELEDTSGHMGECSLDDVITGFESFFEGKGAKFRVRITYVDGRAGVMGHTETEFKRLK
jgi:hypothetical protein